MTRALFQGDTARKVISFRCADQVQDLNIHAMLINGERDASIVDKREAKFLFLQCGGDLAERTLALLKGRQQSLRVYSHRRPKSLLQVSQTQLLPPFHLPTNRSIMLRNGGLPSIAAQAACHAGGRNA